MGNFTIVNQTKYMKIKTEVFGLFIAPGFSLPAYTALSEAFRIANEISEDVLFEWYSIGVDKQLIQSASGLLVKPDLDIDTKIRFDKLAVISSLNSHLYHNLKVFNWLRLLDRRGCHLGGLTSGNWILAKAKLLEGHRCTIHWQDREAFIEQYPELDVSNAIFEIDRSRFSAASGFSAVDMIMRMILINRGLDFAQKINYRLLHERIRNTDEQQIMLSPTDSPKLLQAIQLMQKYTEKPRSLSFIASDCAISIRQLTRLFSHHRSMGPQRFYTAIRLEKAVFLLKQSNLSITEVALACGYDDLSYFCALFKRRFLKTAKNYRSG